MATTLSRRSNPRTSSKGAGSTDASAAIAETFARRDARFRLLRREHAGLVPSLNAGLDACRGRFVARLDADDWMTRDRLAGQAATLDASPSLDAVGGGVRIFPRASMTDGRRAYESWLNGLASPAQIWRERFVECPVAHPTLALRREVLVRFGYRDRGWPEDYDLVLRLLGAGERLAVLPQRLLGWRDGPDRLSRNHAAYGLDRFTACRAHFLAEGPLAGTDRYVLWGYGETGRALRRALATHGKAPERIVEVHPGRVGNRIHGAEVVAPGFLEERTPLPIVVSVAHAGPREEIRHALAGNLCRCTGYTQILQAVELALAESLGAEGPRAYWEDHSALAPDSAEAEEAAP